MKKVVNFADFLAPKNGEQTPFKGGVSVWWHNGTYQMLFDFQLLELLDDGSLRYRFLR